MRKYNDLDTNMHQMFAILQAPREEEDAQTYGEEEEPATIHVYPVAGGGILFSKVPLEQEEPTIIESQEEPDTQMPLTRRPTTLAKEPPCFLSFLLIFCFFLLFDMADSQMTALLTPTIAVTLTPKVHTISTAATLPIGANGNGVPGRVLPELTLTQTQTTQATGHGHQDARAAVGILTFYNGSFSSQMVSAGTVFTDANGIKVATNETVTIPANNPPADGQASIAAHALNVGQAGNIQALAMNGTVSSALFVKNLAPFRGGQNERDYSIMTKADLDRVVTSLAPSLFQSEQAALTTQLAAGEALAPPTCSPTTTADHGPGSEATTIQVTVSETCTGVAYTQQAVQEKASQLLTSMAIQQLGTGYQLLGSIQVTVKQAAVRTHPPLVVLSVTCGGTWVYTLTPQEQQQIKQRIGGRRKKAALQLLLSQPGIDKATITGIGENEVLPDDVTHIHLLFPSLME